MTQKRLEICTENPFSYQIDFLGFSGGFIPNVAYLDPEKSVYDLKPAGRRKVVLAFRDAGSRTVYKGYGIDRCLDLGQRVLPARDEARSREIMHQRD